MFVTRTSLGNKIYGMFQVKKVIIVQTQCIVLPAPVKSLPFITPLPFLIPIHPQTTFLIPQIS